jgi:hypothetical protein
MATYLKELDITVAIEIVFVNYGHNKKPAMHHTGWCSPVRFVGLVHPI